jgi:hypothetical protein
MGTSTFTDYQSNLVARVWIEGRARTDPDFFSPLSRLRSDPPTEQLNQTGWSGVVGSAAVLPLQANAGPLQSDSAYWTGDAVSRALRRQGELSSASYCSNTSIKLLPLSARISSWMNAASGREDSVRASRSGFPHRTVVWTNPMSAASIDAYVPVFRGYVGASTADEHLVWRQELETPTSEALNVGHEERLRAIVKRSLKSLFESANDLQLEDAMESEFSRRLVSLIMTWGRLAVEEIASIINSGETSEDSAWHALRWLGRMHDPPTYQDRLMAIENILLSRRAALRDGAALSLASIDDPHSVPYLQRAIAVEPDTELRQDMVRILEQMRKD